MDENAPTLPLSHIWRPLHKDRVAAREEEIASLGKAECILGRYAEFGPDGAAEGC